MNTFMDIIEDIKDDIEIILGEEEDAYDNMPDNFKSSERGEASEMAIELLEEAFEEISLISEMLKREVGVDDK